MHYSGRSGSWGSEYRAWGLVEPHESTRVDTTLWNMSLRCWLTARSRSISATKKKVGWLPWMEVETGWDDLHSVEIPHLGINTVQIYLTWPTFRSNLEFVKRTENEKRPKNAETTLQRCCKLLMQQDGNMVWVNMEEVNISNSVYSISLL